MEHEYARKVFRSGLCTSARSSLWRLPQLAPCTDNVRGLGADDGVAFDHHKLDVYRRALELLETCDEVVNQLPPGRAHVRDQMDRAACSVVANTAEGTGEFSRKEKALEIIARRLSKIGPFVQRTLKAHAKS